MTDYSDKSWLRSAHWIVDEMARGFAAVAFLLGAVTLIAGLTMWGMWVGQRDAAFVAQHAAEMAKRDAIAKCGGARTYVDQQDGRVICAGGPGGLK